MRNGLIVFAREPLPGMVKTRLAATVGAKAAAELYATMLQDVLNITRQLDGVETIVFWACEEHALSRLAEKYQCASRLQGPGDLGQRMQRAFEEMFTDGFDLCCIIGSDAPDLPPTYILNAYQLLDEQHDVVLGPSLDGGYYLLGLKRLYPQLFRNISWSSPDVLRQSLAAARSQGLTTALLPEWQDIDTDEDLRAFQRRSHPTHPVEGR
jgi:rSAM/selenodomain-associated transferase 1